MVLERQQLKHRQDPSQALVRSKQLAHFENTNVIDFVEKRRVVLRPIESGNGDDQLHQLVTNKEAQVFARHQHLIAVYTYHFLLSGAKSGTLSTHCNLIKPATNTIVEKKSCCNQNNHKRWNDKCLTCPFELLPSN